MDDIDLKIIKILTRNSRTSFRSISKQTGISTDTIIRRYQRFEKERIIHPVITIDYEKMGYQGIVFFFVRIKGKDNSELIIEELTKIPGIIGITNATGLYDMMICALVRDVKHAFKIGREIKQIPNIVKVTIDLFWLPPQEGAIFPPTGWHNLIRQEP